MMSSASHDEVFWQLSQVCCIVYCLSDKAYVNWTEKTEEFQSKNFAFIYPTRFQNSDKIKQCH